MTDNRSRDSGEAGSGPAPLLIKPDDLITDQALSDSSGDEFHHAAIANAVADLTLSTVTPVNIALFGPWGSGKSTLYGLMAERINVQDPAVKVAHYDAWKYGGQELKRNFIQEVARQLKLKTDDFDRELELNQEQSHLRLDRWLRNNGVSIGLAVLLGLAAALGWVFAHTGLEKKWVKPKVDFWDLFFTHVNEFGIVFAGVMTTLVLGPKALESAVTKTTLPRAERDDQFARMFTKLVDRIRKESGAERVVFFIDELDRCQPADVVATLVDLKTFLDEPHCVFVVAADREVIEHALAAVPQSKPIRDTDPYYSTPGAFIDKIFQHQVALPPLRQHALSSFAHRLVDERGAGLWHELKEADPSHRLFDDVIYILVPVHVSSPRRVKVLMNNFATSARIAEARNITWSVRARELAFLTALETEFPSVASSLVHFPQFLTYIRGEKDANDPELTPDRRRILDAFNAESVAGDLLRDLDDTATSPEDNLREERAKAELQRQLQEYLAKLKVVNGLSDPRPDLMYLRVIGYEEGITDADLGEMLDMAADREPNALVDAFADQPAAIQAVAVRLLLQQLATRRGTGQANVLESACRLAAGLPEPQISAVAYLAPEIIRHLGQASMRKAAIPGTVALLAFSAEGAPHLSAALEPLDLTADPDLLLLRECVPALAWTEPDAAGPLHKAIGQALTVDVAPLMAALASLEPQPVDDLMSAVSSAIKTQFTDRTPGDALSLFGRLLDGSLLCSSPGHAVWQVTVCALSSRIPALVDAIHERREEILASLSPEDATKVALYELELSAPSTWTSWLNQLVGTARPVSEEVASWARDTAEAMVAKVAVTTTDHADVCTAVGELVPIEDGAALFDKLLEQVPTVAWGSPEDLPGARWRNLRVLATQLAPTAEGTARFDQAVAEAMKTSVAAELPSITSTATPTPVLNDWIRQARLLRRVEKNELNKHLRSTKSPTPAGAVVVLRVRIALLAGSNHFPAASVIVSVANEPTAPEMAGEWLGLHPLVADVLKVRAALSLPVHALESYANFVSLETRTELWIGVEKLGGTQAELAACGRAGVSGDALVAMRDDILHSTTQAARNVAADRLIAARFAEQPTPAEEARGDSVGHREATSLAQVLAATGVHDNVVLAARLVIRSGGVAHGARGQLRQAFSRFANGKHSRNFTREQARTLSDLGLLDPKKKGRMSWLWDALN